ncbi:MAG: diguanylate cyclase [Coprothermobacterota bacterium]|nr:diguanylate cyclase [Coprothermobacterota bacterium]
MQYTLPRAVMLPQAEIIQILVVEDSLTQAAMLEHVLTREGYRVEVARGGQEALERLAAGPAQLVISDIVMPEMDGFELCRRIRINEKTRPIPVILLTSLTDPKDIIQGLTAGASNFITKPYQNEYLLERVRNVLAHKTLKEEEPSRIGMEFIINDQSHLLSADRLQIVDLLLSTFQTAVQKNLELQRVNEELMEAQRRLAAQAEELRMLSLTDELTGLPNRRAFITLGDHELRVAQRSGEWVFLLYMDVDQFKQINDALSHAVGDQALKDVATVLRNAFRSSDIVARIGGDEFVVMVSGEEEDFPLEAGQRMADAVKVFADRNPRPYRLSLSIGSASMSPGQTTSLDSLMEKADRMMYEQKRNHQQNQRGL